MFHTRYDSVAGERFFRFRLLMDNVSYDMTRFLLNIFFPFWPLIGNVSYDSAVVGRHGHASKQVTIEVGPQFATTSPGRGATSCRILKATATSNFEGVARP